MLLNIPENLKVGFQKREGTFDGKLSFITYYDQKNVLKKEKSWSSWIDSSILPIELENTPTTGFIVNKSINRGSYSFGGGRDVVRIYDPRGFEFEISTGNYVGLSEYIDIIKGELAGQLVFAFDSCGNLILLPVSSEQYSLSMKHTKSKGNSFSAKSLIVGGVYLDKNNNQCIYIGRYNINKPFYKGSNLLLNSTGNKYIFYTAEGYKEIAIRNISHLSYELSDDDKDFYKNTYLNSNLSKPIDTFYFKNDYQISRYNIEKEKIVYGSRNSRFIEKITNNCFYYFSSSTQNYIVSLSLTMEEDIRDPRDHEDAYESNNIYKIYPNGDKYRNSLGKDYFHIKDEKLVEILNKYNENMSIYSFQTEKEAKDFLNNFEEMLFKNWSENEIGVLFVKYKDGTESPAVKNFDSKIQGAIV